MGVLARPATQFNSRAEYWRERREQWARYKASVGCDWVGIARTIVAVDDYLNDLRKKRGPA
jgi:hypothetical protein